MSTLKRWVLAAVGAAGVAVVGGVGGCASDPGKPGAESAAANADGKKKAAPEYNAVAKKYNERVELLGRLFARTVVVLKYTDDEGERRSEQGEGFLQIVRPDKLAMSVNKVGKRLVWFGSDEQRYWWIDLVDHKKAYVGRHDNYDNLKSSGVIEPGLGLRPLDLIQMLGASPLPYDAQKPLGITQWSADSKRLGITVRRRAPGTGEGKDAGLMRVWIDPNTYEASLIELYDVNKNVVLVSKLTNYEHAELRNRGGNSPRVASRVSIAGPDDGPLNGGELRMSLEGIEDHRVNDDAFNFDVVLDETGVAKGDVVDLDAQPARAKIQDGARPK